VSDISFWEAASQLALSQKIMSLTFKAIDP